MTMNDQATYASYLQNQQMQQAANDRATQAYNQSKLSGESEDRALAAAKFAWQKTVDEAGLTGMYQGQYTMPTQQYFANTFGNWGTPTAGQQTMAREQQTFGQGSTLAGLYGQYYAPGTAPTQGQQTLAGAEQGFTQGLRTQQEQRAAQAQQQSQAQQYLSLLAGLRGPADWAKYQQVLGSTPGGLRDLYAAAMGQYVPGGGATTGMQPQAVSLQSLMGDVSGNPYTGQGGGQLNMPNVYGQNTQGMYQQQGQPAAFTPGGGAVAPQFAGRGTAPVQQAPSGQGYMTGSNMYGGLQTMSPQQQQAMGAEAFTPTGAIRSAGPPPQQGGGGTNNMYGGPVQYMPQTQQQNALGGGTNTMGAQPNQMNLPAPNQIAAQSWNNMAPSQREMLLGQYESQGWHKPDVQALMNQALPKYATNAASAGTWRLR